MRGLKGRSKDLARGELAGRGGGRLGLGAHLPHRLLELARREVEKGLHLGGEVGVVLEAESLRNHLKAKAFCNKTAGQKHAMATK